MGALGLFEVAGRVISERGEMGGKGLGGMLPVAAVLQVV